MDTNNCVICFMNKNPGQGLVLVYVEFEFVTLASGGISDQILLLAAGTLYRYC
jgi:hypothetical protein